MGAGEVIWAWLLYWVASANEWLWSVVGEVLSPEVASMSYGVAVGVRTVTAKAEGFGFIPWQVMVTWIGLVFSTFGVVIAIGIVRWVLKVLLGDRNPAE